MHRRGRILLIGATFLNLSEKLLRILCEDAVSFECRTFVVDISKLTKVLISWLNGMSNIQTMRRYFA